MKFHELSDGDLFRSGYDDGEGGDILRKMPEGSNPDWGRANYQNTRTGLWGSCGPMAPVSLANVPETHPAPAPAPTTTYYDFDRGFGIGGLGRYEEAPVIPTEAQMERIEQMEATDIICRRCGASKNFDGAMFTTIRGGNVCDDCVG